MFLKSHEPFRRMKFEERVSRKRRSVTRRGRRLLERAILQEMNYAVHVALTLLRTSIFGVLPCVLLLTLSRIGRPSSTPQKPLPFFMAQGLDLCARAIFQDPRCPIAEGVKRNMDDTCPFSLTLLRWHDLR
jgi:hypothetical protein